jgi:adenylosuccinate synthase
VPAHASGYEQVECVYHKLSGWRTSTEGIRHFEKLPKATQDYLRFIEKETGAKIGMVSTGPGREQTILTDDFASELRLMTERKTTVTA